jgi:hypothetical protein
MTQDYKNLPRPKGLLVVDNIKARTHKMRQLLNARPATPANPEEARLQQIADLAHSKFDCHSPQVCELVELILQVKLPAPSTGSGQAPWVPGALVIVGGLEMLIERTDYDGDAIPLRLNDDGTMIEQGSYIGPDVNVWVATDRQITAWCKRAGLTE